jgi:hypothetical protein
MKRILFLTLFFLPIVVIGQVVRNKPADATSVSQVSDIVSDSIAALSLEENYGTFIQSNIRYVSTNGNNATAIG